ncbi:MAG: DNA-damage-inducible protein J [uncultured Sulfurovum sp.]|uniref:DNA-damage-inducible protein J n=1 Tax=uncultured Sulfurovum sp. TaxID=269237 RepID=A0A6S6SB00_9BACT|nr:MAG: DNA-damage-inducible protein J [uncultured Sulfurovum sp.]
MALDATVRARIDEDLKEDVEKILSEIGLSTSQAITMFMKSIKRERGIPFELKIPNEETLESMREIDNGVAEKVTLEQLKSEAKQCLN